MLRMLSAKYPHCLNHQGLELGEVLVRGQFLGQTSYRLIGEVLSSSNISVPVVSPEYVFLYFFFWEARTNLSLSY